MRRLAGILAILVLLLTAAPMLACMTGAVMGRQENACCHAMHGQCGAMEKMGCCRTQVRSDDHPQFAASAPTIELNLATADWLEPFGAGGRSVSPAAIRIDDAHSPPGLLITQITVLRI